MKKNDKIIRPMMSEMQLVTGLLFINTILCNYALINDKFGDELDNQIVGIVITIIVTLLTLVLIITNFSYKVIVYEDRFEKYDIFKRKKIYYFKDLRVVSKRNKDKPEFSKEIFYLGNKRILTLRFLVENSETLSSNYYRFKRKNNNVKDLPHDSVIEIEPKIKKNDKVIRSMSSTMRALIFMCFPFTLVLYYALINDKFGDGFANQIAGIVVTIIFTFLTLGLIITNFSYKVIVYEDRFEKYDIFKRKKVYYFKDLIVVSKRNKDNPEFSKEIFYLGNKKILTLRIIVENSEKLIDNYYRFINKNNS